MNKRRNKKMIKKKLNCTWFQMMFELSWDEIASGKRRGEINMLYLIGDEAFSMAAEIRYLNNGPKALLPDPDRAGRCAAILQAMDAPKRVLCVQLSDGQVIPYKNFKERLSTEFCTAIQL